MPSPAGPAAVAGGAARVDEPRFHLTHALGVAALLHLLMLLLVTLAPGVFQGPALLVVPPPDELPPIKFTFIDVPDDNVVKENPQADLVSDKTRQESGETPKVTTPEGKNPPSEGNTPMKIAGGEPPRPAVRQPPAEQRLPRPLPPSPVAETSPAPAQETPQATESPDAPQADAGAGAGGRDTETLPPRRDPMQARQERFSRALDRLAARPLPMDLQAVAPPSAEPDAVGSGDQTQWRFNNPNPSYPVRIGSLSFDSKGADFGPWLREFHIRVLNEWNRNLRDWHDRVFRNVVGTRLAPSVEAWNRYVMQIANTRGVTGVVFEVTREGSVVALEMIHPSGTEELDRSVQKTLRNVLLPPLPGDYPDATLRIRAGFYYNVDPPAE